MRSKHKILSLILAAAVLFSMTVCAFTTAVADGESEVPANAIGDVDGSGKCDMQDVVETQRYIAKLKELNNTQLNAADVDEPYDDVNMIDVVCMQKYIAKLIDVFPAESRTSDTDSGKDVTSDSDTENTNTETSDTDAKTSDSDSENTDTEQKILTIAEVVQGGEGKQVTATGQVCYVYGNTSVVVEGIDDDGKVWGVLIYDKEGVINGKYPLNSIIEFSGNTKLYNGYLEVEPTDVEIISENNTPIPPVEAKTSELADYVSIVVIIKNCTLGAYDTTNVTMTDSAGTVNCYKPVSYPEGLSEGSLVDLVCVPYLYSGVPQIRVSYPENYIPVNNSSDTDSLTETDTNSEQTTDTSGNTDDADNGIVLGEPISNLEDILNKNVVVAIENYALSAHSLLNGYGGSFEIKNTKAGLSTDKNTVYNIVKSGDNYYLKSHETGKYFCCKGKTESTFSEDLSEKCAVLFKKDSDGFTINELATGDSRIFALLVNTENSKSTFRWYKGSTSNPSNVIIYSVKTKLDDTDTSSASDNIEDSDSVSLGKKAGSLSEIVGKRVVLSNKGYALTPVLTTESPANVITVGKIANNKTSSKNVFTVLQDSDNTYYLYSESAEKYLCHNTAKESKLLSKKGDAAKLVIKYNNSTECFNMVCNDDDYELTLYTDKTDYTFRWYKYDVNTDMSRSFDIYLVE